MARDERAEAGRVLGCPLLFTVTQILSEPDCILWPTMVN